MSSFTHDVIYDAVRPLYRRILSYANIVGNMAQYDLHTLPRLLHEDGGDRRAQLL